MVRSSDMQLGTTEKFSHPGITAKGERRAAVTLSHLETLWFNTGTLCNIECVNCYIESSPKNDRLVYLRVADVLPFLEEAQALGTREIGFTGGEPFLNPDFIEILRESLSRGFEVLVLTNAMRPMMRPGVKAGLERLQRDYGTQLTMRVSLDHYTQALHETERGAGTFAPTIEGMKWLNEQGFTLAIAGRTCWGEAEEASRAGYKALLDSHNIDLDVNDPGQLVLFPEMDMTVDPPEITTDCWAILGVNPQDMMCSSSRMVVKRKGAKQATVAACTLMPYDLAFDLGPRLKTAAKQVSLNHPHCATFCVLGGGSCSG